MLQIHVSHALLFFVGVISSKNLSYVIVFVGNLNYNSLWIQCGLLQVKLRLFSLQCKANKEFLKWKIFYAAKLHINETLLQRNFHQFYIYLYEKSEYHKKFYKTTIIKSRIWNTNNHRCLKTAGSSSDVVKDLL